MINYLALKELKLIFDKEVNFEKKILIWRARGGDFKNGMSHSDFMFVNIEPHESKKCVSYFKLSKYCDINVCLTYC